MKAPAYLSEPQVQYLSQLLEELKAGTLLIPRFQRPFVWGDDQRLDLLRSVLTGIPIGSILVWRTVAHDLQTFTSIAGKTVPVTPFQTGGPSRQYLLDGHQRLTTLFGALVRRDGNIQDNYEIDWNIQYDLKLEDFFIGQRKASKFVVPTNILLDSLALLRYQRGLSESGAPDEIIERTDSLANAFRNYKLPVVPIVTDDLEDATKAFQRINSSGISMSDVHMVTALSYRPGFDLANELDLCRAKLAEVDWGEFDEKYILATVRAHADLTIANPDAERTSKVIREQPHLLAQATDNLVAAAKFFREFCGIPSPYFLPYSYQAVLIANALRFVEKPVEQEICSKLAVWVWRTTYTGYFLGARENDVSRAMEELFEILEGSDRVKQEVVDPLPQRFDLRQARAKALVIRLAELRPQSVQETAIDVVRLLLTYKAEALPQVMQRGKDTAASGPENRLLLAPSEIGSFRTMFFLGEVFGEEFLRSHAISEEARLAGEKDDWPKFHSARRKTLQTIERDFVKVLGLSYSD